MIMLPEGVPVTVVRRRNGDAVGVRHRDGHVTPVAELAHDSGMTEAEVVRALNELAEGGWLGDDRRSGR